MVPFLHNFTDVSHTPIGGMGVKNKRGWLLHAMLFLIGGLGYNVVELLWRRRTHPSMFVVGGLCFELIGTIQTRVRGSRLMRCGLCAGAVTLVEFISGCILNRWLKLKVWDYSNRRCNLLGQVCLLYTVLWAFLSVLAYPLYRGCYKAMQRLLFCRRRANIA